MSRQCIINAIEVSIHRPVGADFSDDDAKGVVEAAHPDDFQPPANQQANTQKTMTNLSKPTDILSHEEVVFDLSTSITKSHAVSRMLGLGNSSTVFKRVTPITEDGVSPNDLALMHPSMISLEERLSEMAYRARIALIDAAENDASFEVIHQLSENVEEVRLLSSKARDFLMDIDDELAKNTNSLLRVDEDATSISGVTHLSIRSFERWLANRPSKLNSSGLSSAVTESDHLNGASTEENAKKMSKSEKSLCVTLAIAVIAFGQKAGGKYIKAGVASENVKSVDDMNMDAIYQYFADLALIDGTEKYIPGQSASAIKDRIRSAFTYLREGIANS